MNPVKIQGYDQRIGGRQKSVSFGKGFDCKSVTRKVINLSFVTPSQGLQRSFFLMRRQDRNRLIPFPLQAGKQHVAAEFVPDYEEIFCRESIRVHGGGV